MKPEGAVKSAQNVPTEREPVLAKRLDPEERIGEVSGSRRVYCCRGLVQIMGEEFMAKKMTTESHKGERRKGNHCCNLRSLNQTRS